MISKSEKKEYEELLDYGIHKEDPVSLKLAVLSFKDFGKEKKFIYDGQEKMNFCKRHPLYQNILRNEFTDIARSYSKRSFNTHLTF